MNKPTPFRQAVNHLKNLGIIKRDNELLAITGISSKGALSAYLGSKPPKHILDKFLDKYGDHVAHFFTEEQAVGYEKPQESVSAKEYIAELKADKAFLQELMKTALTDISVNLSELLQKKKVASSTKGRRKMPGDPDEILSVKNRRGR